MIAIILNIAIAVFSLLVGLGLGIFNARHAAKSSNIQAKNLDLETERVAYERVEFFATELKTVREELNDTKTKVAILQARLDISDGRLMESERIKQLALNEVSRLKDYIDALEHGNKG